MKKNQVKRKDKRNQKILKEEEINLTMKSHRREKPKIQLKFNHKCQQKIN